MCKYEPIQYPDENPGLGRYMGPAKTMKVNSAYFHRSIYCRLEEDEKSNQDHILLGKEFDKNIREKLWRDISPEDFPNVNIKDTTLYDMCVYVITDAKSGSTVKT